LEDNIKDFERETSRISKRLKRSETVEGAKNSLVDLLCERLRL